MTDLLRSARNAWGWLVAAFVLGAGAGALDLVEREVQGPLLILMTSAFIVAIPRRAPAWAISVATWLALPLVHLIASLRGGESPSWGMLVALPPTLLAAYAGAVAGRAIAGSAATVPRDSLGKEAVKAPWHRRPAESTTLLLATLAVGAVAGVVPVYGTLVARQQPVAWWVATWWQVATFVGWVALLPAILALRKRLGGAEGGITSAQLLSHLAIVLVGATLHAVVIIALTRALFVPLGVASASLAIRWAFTAYLPLDALAYSLVLALAHASDRDRRERLAYQHAAALAAQLDRARLTALEAQIRPHFLFNALNAAVVLVRHGPSDQAVTVLTGLAELLRYVMDDASATVSLGDELSFVEGYLAIEQVRLGDRLRWRVDASRDARQTLVPRLLLQPLVENAVRHGIGRQLRGGEISVLATCEGDALRVAVTDDGAGAASTDPEEGDGRGIGLTNTRARLATMYRGRATLDFRQRPGGGSVVEVTLPRTIETEARSA